MLCLLVYGHGNGVGRRGSVTATSSDAGSDDSALRRSSNGMRKKPLPLLRDLIVVFLNVGGSA